MVVPMLLPSTMAQPIENGIQPLLHIIITMANVAAELWITMVISKPAMMKMSTERNPFWVYDCRKANISGSDCRSGTDELIYCRPRNSTEKPMRNSPVDFHLFFCINSIGTAMPMMGTARAYMLTLNPNIDIIQAVAVVPMLAPIITAIDSASVIRPAFTKLTTITVDADEL